MLRPVAGFGVLLFVVLACACSDGDNPPVVRSTIRVISPGPSPTPAPEITPEPTPALPPISEDWPTYSNPDGLFTIRYPADWHEINGSFFSYDPRVVQVPGYGIASEALKVEAGYYSAQGSSGCGPPVMDAGGSPLPGITRVTLGGVPAWQIVREEPDPAIEGRLTRIQAIFLTHGGYCFSVSGYFTQQQPDVTTFLQIASTFEFKI